MARDNTAVNKTAPDAEVGRSQSSQLPPKIELRTIISEPHSGGSGGASSFSPSSEDISMKKVCLCIVVGLIVATFISNLAGVPQPATIVTKSKSPRKGSSSQQQRDILPRGPASELFRNQSEGGAQVAAPSATSGIKDAFIYVMFVLTGGDGYDGVAKESYWSHYKNLHTEDPKSNLAGATPTDNKYHRRHADEIGWTTRSPLVPHELSVSLSKTPGDKAALSSYFSGLVNAINRLQVTNPFFWTIMSVLRLRDSIRAESILMMPARTVRGFRTYDDSGSPRSSNNSGAGWFPTDSSPFADVSSSEAPSSKGYILSTNMHPTVIAAILYKLVYGIHVHDRFHDFPGRNTAEDVEPMLYADAKAKEDSAPPTTQQRSTFTTASEGEFKPSHPPKPTMYDPTHSREHIFPFTDIIYYCDLPATVEGSPRPSCKETMAASFLDNKIFSTIGKSPFRDGKSNEAEELFGIQLGEDKIKSEIGLLHKRMQQLLNHVTITIVERGPLTKKPENKSKKKVYSIFPQPDSTPTRPFFTKSDALRHVPRERYNRIVYLDYDTWPQMPLAGTTEVLNSQKALSYFKSPGVGISYEKERKHKSAAAKKAAQEKENQKSKKKKLAKKAAAAGPEAKAEGQSSRRKLLAMENELAGDPIPEKAVVQKPSTPPSSATLVLNRPLFQRPIQTKIHSGGQYAAPSQRGEGGDNITITRVIARWSDLFNLISPKLTSSCGGADGKKAANSPVAHDIAFAPEYRHQHNLAPHLYNAVLYPVPPPLPSLPSVPSGGSAQPPPTLDTVIESAPPGTYPSLWNDVGTELWPRMHEAYLNDSFGIAHFFDGSKIQGFTYESQFNTGLMAYRNDFGVVTANDEKSGTCPNVDSFMKYWSWVQRTNIICKSDRTLWDQCSLTHAIRSLSRQVKTSMQGEKPPSTLSKAISSKNSQPETSSAPTIGEVQRRFSSMAASESPLLQPDVAENIPAQFKENIIRIGQISEVYNYRDALGTPNQLLIGGQSFHRAVSGSVSNADTEGLTAFDATVIGALSKLETIKSVSNFCSSSGLVEGKTSIRDSLLTNALLDLRNKEISAWDDEEQKLINGAILGRYITVMNRQPWQRNTHDDVPLFYHFFKRVMIAMKFASDTHNSRPIPSMPNVNVPGGLSLVIDPVKTTGVGGSKFMSPPNIPTGFNIKNTPFSHYVHDPTYRSSSQSVLPLARLRRLRMVCGSASSGGASTLKLWKEALGQIQHEESVLYRYRSVPEIPQLQLQRLPRFVINFVESSIYKGRFLMDHRSRSIKHRLPISVAFRLGFEVSVASKSLKPDNAYEELYHFDWARVASVLYCPPVNAPKSQTQAEIDSRKRSDPNFRPYARPSFTSWQEESSYDCASMVSGDGIGIMYVFGED